jgi:hypothetical protein
MLLRERGLKPWDIDELTWEQLQAYLDDIQRIRMNVPPLEITLCAIKEVLFKWLGVRETTAPAISKDVYTQQVEGLSFPKFKLTKEEILAYQKAGMPSPFTKWLKDFRRKKKGG